MKFVTLFPEARNIELVKDVGMIPYILGKQYKVNSKLVCYNNGKYPYLETEVKGLKISFLKKYSGKPVLDGAIYLLKNSKKIDVLHLFHFSKRSFLWIMLYKFLNPNGKVYLKLDANRNIKDKNLKCKSLKNDIKKIILNKCKLISVETKELYEYINENWPVKVQLIPNGFKDNRNMRQITIEEKENYIITVGRIGAKEKANEILMEAFAKVQYQLPNWKVKLIGPIEDEFVSYINNFFDIYPTLKGRVIFTGAIYDKDKLDEEYRKAKIFCLTSLYESFGLVLVEAIKNGCYIISSDVPAAYDITNNQQYGEIFDVGNVNELKKLLLKNCKLDNKLKKIYSKIQDYAYKNYTWESICKTILEYLQ